LDLGRNHAEEGRERSELGRAARSWVGMAWSGVRMVWSWVEMAWRWVVGGAGGLRSLFAVPLRPGINARATVKTKSRLKPAQFADGGIEPPSGGFLVPA
jgi:hypothetical protein